MRNVDSLRTYFLSILRRETRLTPDGGGGDPLLTIPKPSFVAGADGSMQLVNDLSTAVAVFSGGAADADYIELIAGNAVSPPQVHSAGVNTDVDLDITTQGTGAVRAYGGDATSGNTAGGNTSLVPGNGFGSGQGGSIVAVAGTGGATGEGGGATLVAGPGGATSGAGGAWAGGGGSAAAGGSNGGAVTLTGGNGATTGTGGAWTAYAGTGGATGAGGATTLRGGAGGATSGAGGALTLAGGAATGGNSAGGAVTISSGVGSGNAASGNVTIRPGTAGATGAGGTLALSGGHGGSTSGNGGSVGITGGLASFNGGSNGGAVTIAGGAGNAAGIGGSVTISPGNSGTAANRGNINFTDQAGVNVVGLQKNADGSAYCLAATAATDLAGGNITINAITGKFRIAAGQTAVTITCNRCLAASSTVILTKYAGVADATMTHAEAVAGAGSFVVTGNAACTGNVDWQFLVINAVV